MYNWLEGIFQYHTWLKWGIGILSGADTVEHMTDHDMCIDLARGVSENEILDKEILELQKESQIHNDIPLNLAQCEAWNIFRPKIKQILWL